MQIFIDSIFPESEDVDTCISWAVDSIGLKELPSYEVKIGDQCNWIQKTQVHLLSVLCHQLHKIGVSFSVSKMVPFHLIELFLCLPLHFDVTSWKANLLMKRILKQIFVQIMPQILGDKTLNLIH